MVVEEPLKFLEDPQRLYRGPSKSLEVLQEPYGDGGGLKVLEGPTWALWS